MNTDFQTAEALVSAQKSNSGGLDILYEHPAWFEKLFAELDRRNVRVPEVLAPRHFFDPGTKNGAKVPLTG